MSDTSTAVNQEREFKCDINGKEITLPDPNPEFTPEEVMQYYSSTYPELTTATIDAPKVEGAKVTHKVKTTVGTKG
jgi:PRTRC genetic system protein C